MSTVGGWAACRGAGQASSRYGKIEDIVVGLQAVLPDGRLLDVRPVPRRAVGPGIQHLLIGSEGVFGFITELTLRICRLPECQSGAVYAFASLQDGLDAMREIVQREGRPTVMRLYDRTESRARTEGIEAFTAHPILAILEFSGPRLLATAEAALASEVCLEHAAVAADEAPYREWKRSRYHSYSTLQGERAPHWDPLLRASFIGMRFHHEPGHFVRALYEGIAFSLRDVLEQFRARGIDIRSVRIAGGGARSACWRQVVADVLGVEVHLPRVTDASFGAALLAGIGAGLFADEYAAALACTEIVARTTPIAHRSALYQELFDLYRRSHLALAPIDHALSRGFSAHPVIGRFLHGEAVAFGTLAQLAAEGRTEAELTSYAALAWRLRLPVSFACFGIGRISARELEDIARIACTAPYVERFAPPIDALSVHAALELADRIGRGVSHRYGSVR